MKRAWTRLPSGNRLDLINPDKDAWDDLDLAIRISRTNRWSGESIWSLPLTVAQHSLSVLALRCRWSPIPLSPGEALRELLHDAEEAWLGFDCISPLKGVLGASFKDISERLAMAVNERYKLPDWTQEAYRVHKLADEVIAASEAIYCAGWSEVEIRDVLNISHPFLDTDPLTYLFNCEPWEPWSSEVASERFYQTLTSCLRQHLGDDMKTKNDAWIKCVSSGPGAGMSFNVMKDRIGHELESSEKGKSQFDNMETCEERNQQVVARDGNC